MNAKISVIVICVEPIIYLLLYNLHDCTFNRRTGKIVKFFKKQKLQTRTIEVWVSVCSFIIKQAII